MFYGSNTANSDPSMHKKPLIKTLYSVLLAFAIIALSAFLGGKKKTGVRKTPAMMAVKPLHQVRDIRS